MQCRVYVSIKSVTRYTSDMIIDNISGIVTNIKGQ